MTINDNITLTGANLTLASSGAGAIVGVGTPVLTASTVSLRQVAEFDAIAVFDFTATSLTLSRTEGGQTIHPWMQTALTGGSITITVPGTLTVGEILDFGTNNITLTSGGRVRIGGNITTSGNIILTGGTSQPAIRFESGAIVVTGGNIRLNGSAGVRTSTDPTDDRIGGNVTLNANATSGTLTLTDDIDTGTNNLSLTGAAIQIGRRGSDTLIELSGAAITLTSSSTNGIQLGRFSGSSGDFEVNNRVTNLAVTATGTLIIAANIMVDSTATSGGDIALTGGSIDFTDARTITGGAIRLIGAVTSAADLTITARGDLRIDNDINTGAGNLTLMSTGGEVRIVANITTTTGNITLSGVTDGISFNGGRAAKTLSGAIVTLTGNVVSNRALTITARGILTINDDITLSSGLTLALSGAGAIGNGGTTGSDRPRLTASTVSLTQTDAFAAEGLFRFRTGSLVLNTDAAQTVHNWMISTSRDVTLMSVAQVRVGTAIGPLEEDRDLGTGSLTLMSTGADVRIDADITTTGNITLNGNGGGGTGIDLSGGARTISGVAITLTGVAASNASVTITATGALTLNDNIALTGDMSILALSGAGAISNGDTVRVLTASTVSLRQVDAFEETDPLFTFGAVAATGSLVLITDAEQVVYDWMITLNRNLTVESSNRVRVNAAIVASGGDRALGMGNLTLTSTGRRGLRILADISTTTGAITLSGVTGGINLNGTDTLTGTVTLTGAIITLIGNAQSNRALTIDADTTLALSNDIRVTGSANDLSLTGGTIQIGRRGSDTRILLRSDNNITLTSTSGIQIGRFSGSSGDFEVNNRVANLTVDARGTLTIAADITVDSTATSGGDIQLRSRTAATPIDFTGARTITGGDIRLRGAATGAADLTITASGDLRIDNNITLTGDGLTLALSGAGAIVGTDRPTLTASTVRLRQDAAFDARRVFRFGDGSSLEFFTAAAQDVYDWMINDGIDLTVTSVANVIVRSAIGSGGRDLGNGNLMLTSTGGLVRIFADISTGGNLTLSGVTDDGINFSGGVRILNGVAITLTGNARSNRALTLNATGVLTINNNIDIGTGTLDLTGSSLTFGSSVDLTAGDHIFDPSRTCNTGTMPSCTVTP